MSFPTSTSALVSDTDVVSFLFNRDPVRSPRYATHFDGRAVVLPFAAVGELLYGAEHRNWGPGRRMKRSNCIRQYQIEYPNYATCEIWAEVRATARRSGLSIERQDAWMAATAIYLDVPLVTHNASHYAGIPHLRVITEPDTPP